MTRIMRAASDQYSPFSDLESEPPFPLVPRLESPSADFRIMAVAVKLRARVSNEQHACPPRTRLRFAGIRIDGPCARQAPLLDRLARRSRAWRFLSSAGRGDLQEIRSRRRFEIRWAAGERSSAARGRAIGHRDGR